MRAIAMILLLFGAPALAQDTALDDDGEVAADSDLVRAAVERGEIEPLSVLLLHLAAKHPGEVLDVEVELRADGSIDEYEFEVLTPDGRLIEVDIDAATGVVTEVSDEDPEDDAADDPDDEDG